METERKVIELKMRQIFTVVDIINKMGLTDTLEILFTGFNVKGLTTKQAEAKQTKLTADLFSTALKGLPKVQTEVTELIADLKEITVEEAGELSLTETVSVVKDIFNNEEVQSFFK